MACDDQAPEGLHRQRGHGSVRLFHSQLLTKPTLTFLVSYETNEFCTTSFFRGNGKVPKRDWFMIAAFTNTKDAIMFKLFFSTVRNRDCCCSVNCVVASRYATASDHCVIVDQPHRHDGDL
jgi:hypothetical protein